MKKKDEIERKMEQFFRETQGTHVEDWARKDSALFKHGIYEALVWVLEDWGNI